VLRARNHAFFHFLGPGFRAGEHDSDLPCRIQHKAYTKPENLCSDEFMDDIRQIEHRRSRRVGMKQALLVRPSDPKDGSFEELGTTKNVSQGGVYFVTQRKVYYEGMRLSVTVPYSATGTQNYECRGRVTGVEEKFKPVNDPLAEPFHGEIWTSVPNQLSDDELGECLKAALQQGESA
jgi:hypothetical protein